MLQLGLLSDHLLHGFRLELLYLHNQESAGQPKRTTLPLCHASCQNLLLLIAARWHFQPSGVPLKFGNIPDFAIRHWNMGIPVTLEKVVALIFYGYSDEEHIDARSLSPLHEHLD